MFLTYNDLQALFPKVGGIQDKSMNFHTVACRSNFSQHKGIFIPTSVESGELLEAINNGAIAALWDESKPVPKYTPNHFPIFFTDDLVKGLIKMIKLYIEKIEKIKLTGMNNESMTNFLFLDENSLNEHTLTYDIAGITNFLQNKVNDLTERRG